MRRSSAMWLESRYTLVIGMAVLGLLLAGLPATAAAKETPVAAYSFDAGEGNAAEDLAGENDGAIEGAEWSDKGRFGSALYFDGTTDLVAVPDSNQLDLTDEFTLEAWVRPDEANEWSAVITKEREGNLSYQMHAEGQGHAPVGYVQNSEGIFNVEAGDDPIPVKTWSHVTLTYDGAKLRYYVNGELKGTDKSGEPAVSADPLFIGGNAVWGEEDAFKGRIDEVRIYDRALGEDEIASDLDAPVETPSRGPVAAYSFDAGEGNVAEDLFGENDGTIEGAEWSGRGKYGKALLFDGPETCLTVAHHDDLQLEEEMTVEAWVKPRALSDQPVIYKSAWGNLGYALGISFFNTAKAEGLIGEGPGKYEDVVSPEDIEENVWSHLAFTYDGATMRLYVNGELVASQAQSTPPPGGQGPLAIGCNPLYPEDFDGLIDEVRIYDRALGEGKIASDRRTPLETPSRGPVAAYSFDAGEGNVAEDLAGDNDGEIEGATWFEKGKYGKALLFDGPETCLTVAHHDDLQLEEEMTVEAWVKPRALSDQPVIYKSAWGNLGYALGIDFYTPARPEGLIGEGPGKYEDVVSPDPVEENVWSHLAFTYDGATMRLYVNGELVATQAQSTPPPGGEGPLAIGCNPLYPEDFDGLIDEVRIYDRALGLDEVVADSKAGIETPARGPVAAYSFDAGKGNVAEDLAGAHNGTLEGPEWSDLGKFGSALHFDGVEGEQVTVPDSKDLDLTDELTLEAWVRPTEAVEWSSIVTKKRGTGISYQLVAHGDHNAPVGYLANAEKEWGVDGGTTPLPANTWSHIAFTSDGARLRFYVNGKLKGSDSMLVAAAASTDPLAIGGETFKGLIDEVRIYDRALDGEELTADKSTPIQTPPRAPVAAYSLDAATGSIAHDLTGENDGEIVASDWVRGKYGSALYFDGTDDYVEIPDSPELQLRDELTLSAWVRPDAVEDEGAVISKTAGNFFSYQLYAGSREFAGIPEGFLGYEPWAWDDVEDDEPLEAKAWSHLALTYDGSLQRLYVNGELVDTSYEPTPPAMASVGPLYLGGNEGAEDFKGRVDEVRIYARALDERELAIDRTTPLRIPDTVIDTGPEGLTNDATPTFTYHSTMTGSTFVCAIDGGGFVSCPAGSYTVPALADGEHTLSVKAINPVGVIDRSPATRSFTVDATAPETTIEDGPEGATNDPQPTFEYGSPDPGARFECRVDSDPFEPCGYGSQQVEPPLADGSHTFAVRAVDPAGNVDPTPATRSFTVDATAPTVQILTGPSGPTKVSKPKFTFEAAGQTVLQCVLDADNDPNEAPSYGACSGSTYHEPAAALADGSYTFRVRVADASGNDAVDSRSFKLDTKAPDTTIAGGPSGTTDDPKPSFEFSSTDPDSSFACRFDAQAFAACSGPGNSHAPNTALASGAHSFEVRATDPSGNTDGTPAKRSFTVFTAAPQTKIDSGPEGPTATTTPTFTYSADEAATFECRVDSAAFANCLAGGHKLAAQSEGEHVFEVRARNSAGADPTPARRTFIVDVSNPAAPVLGGEVFAEPGPYGLNLKIQANDGDRSAPSTTRSGVEAATVWIDGQQAVALRNRCGANGCPDKLEREYQVSPFKAAGTHTYKVVISDRLGNQRAAEWSRTIPSNAIWRPLVSPKAKCTGTVTVTKSEPKYVGTPCAEKIVVAGGGVKSINAMGGNDEILGGPGKELIIGGPGNDTIRGSRNNDTIFGNANNDHIYGGLGDDPIRGGSGNDVIDGGPGGDKLRGQGGDDTLRGGQGKDVLRGEGDQDTASFADAISPGFVLNSETRDFNGGPVDGQIRGTTGVYVEITNGAKGNGTANNGSVSQERGGIDDFYDIEKIVGSAFDDAIKRPDSKVSVSAGPGADIIVGGGADKVNAGPGDNFVEGDPQRSIHHPDQVQFGIQNPEPGEKEGDLFLSGSDPAEAVTVRLKDGSAQFVFGSPPGVEPTNCSGKSDETTFTCDFEGSLGAVVLAGFGGADVLSVKGRKRFDKGSVTIAGGPGGDTLNGGGGEDLLIDGSEQGAGQEKLSGMEGDDVLIQGDGKDTLKGDGGNDLLVSSKVCGDGINGGKGVDNAQFHPFASGPGAYVDLSKGTLGERADGKHGCSNVSEIEDLEGSPKRDEFRGTGGRNLILGRGGADVMIGNGGADSINAKDNTVDALINCSNSNANVHVDKKIERTEEERAKGQLKASLFRHCDPKRVDFSGATYDDKEGSGNSLALFAEPGELPERLARLLGTDETEPPESSSSSPAEGADLASYLALDETEGTVARNAFEEGNDGTYEAAGVGPSVNGPGPQLGAAGGLIEEEGNGVSLDGVNDLISLPGPMGLEQAGDNGFSLELLVRFTQAPGTKEYLYSTGQGSNGLFLYRASNGVLTLAAGEDQGAPEVNSYLSVADNGWHQVVAVVEDRALTLYLDGIPSRVGFGQDVIPELPSPAPAGRIGAGPGLAGFLSATVDELSTYIGPLSEAEVLLHLQETTAAGPSELLVPEAETADGDGDGVTDGEDNCPTLANANQADVNEDGVGDACLLPDIDGDGVGDGSDNCPEAVNGDQADGNSDGVGDACASLPPEVTSGEATEVKAGSATLNGVIIPGGTATRYWFRYGATTSYGRTIPVPPGSLASGGAPISVSRTPSGLKPQTTYHYRLVAENEFGKTFGEDRTFTTPK